MPVWVLSQAAFWHEATILSYAQVLLTNRLLLGWIALGATALEPAMAIAGLAGVIVANGGALLLKFNRDAVRTGYYGFNALLVALALSYYYRLTVPLLLLIALSSLLTLLLTIGLTSVLNYYVQLPTLSLPFVLVTVMAYLAAGTAGGLELEPKALGISAMLLSLDLPPWLETFVRSLGSILFMPNLGSGALLFVGLLAVSRLLAIFAGLGYLAGFLLYLALGIPPLPLLSQGMLGFNLMLTAMVLGGTFVIPSPQSYLLAVAGSAVCALFALALRALLTPVGLPVLTAPFIATTLLILYAMKFREHGAQPRPVTFLPGTPEENLDYAATRLKRFGSYETVRFSLPFYGEWLVSQGVQGPYTHKEQWAFAWDFVVADEEGRRFRNSGRHAADYYAYRLPVLAPADGIVIRAVDGVPDNEVGLIDAKANWGNHVVIRHTPLLYSVLAHLSPGSLRVREGSPVRRADCVALCGNSGRSVEPHLHFHVQDWADLGARTVCPSFARFIRKDRDGRGGEIMQQSVPEQGTRVRRVEADAFLPSALNFHIGRRWTFHVRTASGTRTERWVVSVDFSGTLFLESSPSGARAWIWRGDDAFTVLSYVGRPDTALFAFAMGASLVPLAFDPRLRWKETLPYRYFLPTLTRLAVDVARPFFELVSAQSRLRWTPFQERKAHGNPVYACGVEGEISISSTLSGQRRRKWKTVVALERTLGPVYIRLDSPRGMVLEAEVTSFQ